MSITVEHNPAVREIRVFEAELQNADEASVFWDTIRDEMALAIINHADIEANVVDARLLFHRRALMAMVASGFHHVRYIQVGSGMVPIARSGGFEEHWWFIGSLLNCSFEPPCTPKQLLAALQHVPALADPYIHPLKTTACQLIPSDEGCEFDIPTDFTAWVAAAPKKQRSEWGRLMRKAEAAGIQWQIDKHSPRYALDCAYQLIEQYAAYWADRNDSYSDESQMMRQTLKAFAEAHHSQWIGLVIGDKQGNPIAVNFAWVKRGVVYDTICIRDVREELRPYSLGVLAILWNLQICSELGHTRYSLAAGDQQYKRQFNYEKPTVQSNLVCISDIDVVLGNYPGYYNGVWATADQPVILHPAQIAHIHDKYPFTLEEEE